MSLPKVIEIDKTNIVKFHDVGIGCTFLKDDRVHVKIREFTAIVEGKHLRYNCVGLTGFQFRKISEDASVIQTECTIEWWKV